MKSTALKLPSFFRRWEALLLLLFAAVIGFFSFTQPAYYTPRALLGNTQVFMDVGFQALGMMLVLMLGDIDISVGATSALSCTILAVAYNKGDGIPFMAALLLALLVGTLCGALNGFFITRFPELFPMIITLSTQTIYRGISYILLKDQSLGGFPRWFTNIGYGTIGNTGIPINLCCFLILAAFFYLFVHKTPTGRRLFAMGTNATACRFSGIRTDRIKFSVFMFNGFMAAVCGIFLTARTSSVRPNMALGYEMQAIAVAVLGGVSTAGGKGNVLGVVMSLLTIGFLKFGLKVSNVNGQLEPMVIGILLILITLLPNIASDITARIRVRNRRAALSPPSQAGTSA